MSDQLKVLAQIISSGVENLEAVYAKKGTECPSLNVPCESLSGMEEDVDVNAVAHVIIAAANQLVASLRTPLDLITDCSAAYLSSSTLAFANDNNIADLLKAAGTQGLDSKEIGERIGVDGRCVARSLRYLATRHIFQEVRLNVFANNRHSSVLVKAKPFEKIEEDLLTKYDEAPFSALANLSTEEGFKGGVYFSQFLKDPKGYPTPFNMAVQDHSDMFTWYQHPDRLWRGRRFSSAMRASADRWPGSYFSSAFDWNALSAGSTVVDVGGNVGTVTMAIARTAPNNRYIVQDLKSIIEVAKQHWTSQWPEALTDGTVSLEAHNFFEPMPVTADVYFMRSIIHDWSDTEARKILLNIRAAAKPTSKLILFEIAALPACQDTSALNDSQKLPNVPYPLLSNLGLGVGGYITLADLQIFTFLGGGERTVEDFEALCHSAGWMLESVKPGPIAAFIFTPSADKRVALNGHL